MGAPAPQVGVVGLRALQRDLLKMGADAGELNAAFKTAGREALQPIAAAVRAALPQDSGALAGDVRVTASRSGGAVRMGRASIRYAGWVEFGGHRKVPHPSERPFVSTGRYMFPAARPLYAQAATTYTDAVNRVLASFGYTNPDTAAPESIHD